jgi:hypothetical protein
MSSTSTRRRARRSSLALLALASVAAVTWAASAYAQAPPASRRDAPALSRIADGQRSFEKVRADSAQFVSRGPGYDVAVTPAGASLTLRQQKREQTLRMTLAGGNSAAALVGIDALGGLVYHVTSGSHGPLVGNGTYRRVKANEVYPGVDLLYYLNDRQLEFDFIVAPHHDPRQIRLKFSGAGRMTLDQNGELSFNIDGEKVRLEKPRLYQDNGSSRDAVSGRYRIVDAASREVAFDVGSYDSSRPLVIDPAVVFATYRGGPGDELASQLKVSPIGEVYLLADASNPATLPQNGPTQTLPLAPPQSGFSQCFLSKFSSDGGTVLYTVIFQGAQCQAMDVAFPPVTPETKIHLQVGTSFHYQRTITEHPDGSLSIDLLQGAYDVCQTGSCGPVQWMRADRNGNVLFVMNVDVNGTPGYELRKIDPQGQLVSSLVLFTTPIYPTSFGDYIADQVTGFDIDDSGNAYVVGYGATPGLIAPTPDALQRTRPSGTVCVDITSPTCNDAFVLKIDASGPSAKIVYASWLGGNADDRAAGVVWDAASGDILVAGNSASNNFPLTPGASYPAPPAGQGLLAGFLVKLDLQSSPAQAVLSVFLPTGFHPVSGITVLPGSLPAVVGQSFPCFGNCFPFVHPLYPAPDTLSHPFLAVFSADGSLVLFSTFLDQTAGADGFAANVASNGSSTLYIAMTTNDGRLGTPGASQPTLGGGLDALVQAIDVSSLVPRNNPPQITFTPSTIDVSVASPNTGGFIPLFCGRQFACSLTDPDGDLITQVAWLGPNGFQLTGSSGAAPASANLIPGGWVQLPAGTYTFTVQARDERGAIGTGTLRVNVHDVNTFSGGPQHVVLTDPYFVEDDYTRLGSVHPIELDFPDVSDDGLTWLASRADLIPPPPLGLQAGSPPYYYDIQSTASFDTPFTVCFNIRGMSFPAPESDLLIYQLLNGAWTALDNQFASSADQICADAPDVGTFAIFYPQVPETAISTIAGTGYAEGSIDGLGGDRRDDFNDFVPAVQSTVTRPTSLAVSTAGSPKLYVIDDARQFTGLTRLRQIDLTTGQISTRFPVCDPAYPTAIDPGGEFFYCAALGGVPGQITIQQHDLLSAVTANAAVVQELQALAVDQQGNLFYATALGVYRQPGPGSSGSTTLILGYNNSTQAAHSVSYFDAPLALAFDGEGALLAGGQTIVRVTPGADGLVDGSSDETVTQVAGIPGANLAGHLDPFQGDGLPATQAVLAISYQMTVAPDGAVVFADGISHRIRRIAPGEDGVVNGGADEIVQTIAGYYSFTAANPSGFATSAYGDFRGIAVDPLSPGHFIVSSYLGHVLQRFGIAGAAANQPPTVSIFVPPTTVYAESPAGATVSLTATASDPDGDPLTYSWSGPFTDSPAATNAFITGRLPLGHQTITVTVDDGHGHTGSASATIDVIGASFVGTTATPVDAGLGGLEYNAYAPLTVTVATPPPAGSHVFLKTRTDQNPPIPANLQAGSPPIYFDVSTDAASLPTPIDVCVDTRGMSLPIPSTINLYQYESTGSPAGWTSITTQVAPGGTQVCGRTDSLGTFAIFYPQIPVTAIRTIAGNGVLAGSASDFVAGPATGTPLPYLYGGAYDRAHNLLYVSDGFGYILRVDLTANTIARAAGNGVLFLNSLPDPNDLRDDIVDGGDPFNTFVGLPFQMAISPSGNPAFFDLQTCRIRRLDVAQNKLFNVAGNGSCGFSGDGGPASSASVNQGDMAYDSAGNLFVSDLNNSRIRRIDAQTGVITTVAGNGTFGVPTQGAPALSAIGSPGALAFDARGGLLVYADLFLIRINPGADGLVRGDADEIVTIVGGCNTNCQQPFSGDGLPITHPQVFLPQIGHLFVAHDGAVIFSDGSRIRRIAPGADGVVTGAADEIVQTIGSYYDTGTNQISNFNGDTFATQALVTAFSVAAEDDQGRILVVDGNNYRVRRFGFVTTGAPNRPPSVDAGPDQQVNAHFGGNAVVHLSGSAIDPDGDPLTFEWLDGATVLGTSAALDVSLAPGTHVLTLSVSDGSHTVTDTVTITVVHVPASDIGLQLSTSSSLGVQPAGMPIVIPMTLKNLGPDDAASVTLTLGHSTALAFGGVNFTADGLHFCILLVGGESCGIGPIPARSTLDVTVTVTPTAIGSFTLALGVSSSNEDGNQANNSTVLTLSSALMANEVVRVVDAVSPPDIAAIETIAVHDNVLLSGFGNPGVGDLIVGETIRVVDAPSAPDFDISEQIHVKDTTPLAADTVPPVLTLPANLTREATGPAGAIVIYGATAIDDLDGAVTVACTPAPGATFALGTTTVNCSATDAHGNTSTGTFTVSVVDTTKPTLSLPGNVAVPTTGTLGQSVTYSAAATDLVSGSLTPSCTPASGSTFPYGVTTVTCSAVDGAGNRATGSFTVTVATASVATVQLVTSAVFSKNAAGQYVADITIRNAGSGPATSVTLTSAVLNSTPGTPRPTPVGTLAPGASVTVREVFPGTAGSPGSANVLRLSLTWVGGAATVSQRATLP